MKARKERLELFLQRVCGLDTEHFRVFWEDGRISADFSDDIAWSNVEQHDQGEAYVLMVQTLINAQMTTAHHEYQLIAHIKGLPLEALNMLLIKAAAWMRLEKQAAALQYVPDLLNNHTVDIELLFAIDEHWTEQADGSIGNMRCG